MTRDNVELKKEIIQTKTQQQKIQIENAELRKEIIQIIGKQQQTQTECNENTNEINKINEELRQAKRELTQLTKKLDIEKENNVRSNKKFEDRKNESERQIVTLKAINLDLEIENAELRKEIIQIIGKQQQTQTECNENTNEINKINEELRQAKRELTQLTKKLDIEKENNVRSNKKFEDRKNESERQIVTLKAINLDLENKINNKNMNNETTTGKQDQQHLLKSNREIRKKVTQDKQSIYVIDLIEQSMKDQQLQEITKKYGRVINQEIRKDKGKRGNIAIVSFLTKNSSEKAMTGINKTNKYIAKNMNMKPIVKYL